MTYCAAFCIARAKDHSREAHMDNRPRTHGARLFGGVERAIVQPPITDGLLGLCDGEHLGVGGGIVRALDRVVRGGQDFATEFLDLKLSVKVVDSLDEAIRLSNESVYGLTAGVYSEDPAEVDRFLATIEAGVLYVNRRAGATTGAWPGVQAFGGWKGSGSTGKAGLSLYYPAHFMREQSHTVVD